MGLPWNAEELEGSPLFEADDEGAKGRRVFRVPRWEDWQPFCKALLGRWETVGDQVWQEPPAHFPGNPELQVWRVRVEPMDPQMPRGLASWEGETNRYPDAGARVTADYRFVIDEAKARGRKLPRVPVGTLLTYQASLAVEYVNSPARMWVWDDAAARPLPDDVRPRLLRPLTTHVLTWHRVTRPPFAAMSGLRGMVNAEAFLESAPGTMLFAGAEVKRQFHFLENGGFWQVKYSFVDGAKALRTGEPVAGWNHFSRRPQEGGELWKLVKAAGVSPVLRPYASTDFSPLFMFE